MNHIDQLTAILLAHPTLTIDEALAELRRRMRSASTLAPCPSNPSPIAPRPRIAAAHPLSAATAKSIAS
jgi:hypothetical protein